MKILVLLLIFGFPLYGCTTSYYNIGEEGMSALGGGFIDTKPDESFYQIIAKSNLLPWTDFGAAREIFDKRATELCGENGYQIVETTESTYDHNPIAFGVPPIISNIEGIVLCKTSPLTLKEAKEQIRID